MSLLARGLHCFYWPKQGWYRDTDVAKWIRCVQGYGLAGVIPQAGLGAAHWLRSEAPRGPGKAPAPVLTLLREAGLQVTVGLGLDGDHTADEFVRAILEGIERTGSVMLDWESRWDKPDGEAFAEQIVEAVLKACPEAPQHITDCPWWAPLSLPVHRDVAHAAHGTQDAVFDPGEAPEHVEAWCRDHAEHARCMALPADHAQHLPAMPVGHPTHPHAPTATFGRLCGQERYPQCYGAPLEGRSQRMLAWARDPSQYASLGSWEIRPTYQGYQRSLNDQVQALIAEPTVVLWDWAENDAQCWTALQCVGMFRHFGFDGPGAVEAFQRHAGLEPDGLVVPATRRALGC
jgi:hypothetical protein